MYNGIDYGLATNSRRARGIASGDRCALETFGPIVRYTAVDPDELSERPSTADRARNRAESTCSEPRDRRV